jgi:hypothetical protein
LYKDLIKKPKNTDELLKKATISKEAQINKQAVNTIKESDQNFNNYIDYLTLNKLSEDNEAKKESVTKAIRKNNKNENDRKKNSVKDKEKEKRMKGQSSHSTWKSETFMKLRQEFD